MPGHLIATWFSLLLASVGSPVVPSGKNLITKPTINTAFTHGERLEYRVHYGFINAGEGVMVVSDQLYRINSKPCYRIEVTGKTIGSFDLFLRIRNAWGTYVDTNHYLPQKSFRSIQEGKYKRLEETYFDYEKRLARMEVKDKQPVQLSIPDMLQDMVSGYYNLRLVDYNNMKSGDTLKINGILEDQVYDFKIRYMGKHWLKTKYGHIKTILLKPVLPNNALFAGENAISLWISDDANKIPLKCKADMVMGAVELDLKKMTNLRHPIQFKKKPES